MKYHFLFEFLYLRYTRVVLSVRCITAANSRLTKLPWRRRLLINKFWNVASAADVLCVVEAGHWAWSWRCVMVSVMVPSTCCTVCFVPARLVDTVYNACCKSATIGRSAVGWVRMAGSRLRLAQSFSAVVTATYPSCCQLSANKITPLRLVFPGHFSDCEVVFTVFVYTLLMYVGVNHPC